MGISSTRRLDELMARERAEWENREARRRRAGYKLTEEEYQEALVEATRIIHQLIGRCGGREHLPLMLSYDVVSLFECAAVAVSLAPETWEKVTQDAAEV